jgi:hypothetical protein
MSNIDKKTGVVVFTTNLDIFKFHEVNRDITNVESVNRIKRIADSMNAIGVLQIPIIVNRQHVVVDGQHRLSAAKLVGKGIYYIVDDKIPCNTKGIFEWAKNINKNAKEWGKKDYIHGLAKQGNQNYQILQDFSDKYPMFSLTERIMLLMNSGSKSVDKADFSDGKFEIGSLRKAELWAQHLLEIKPYFEQGYNKSNFVRTLLTILEKKKEFKFDEFLHKVKVRPTELKVCGDKKSYAELIESIYNYKRKSEDKINLRF